MKSISGIRKSISEKYFERSLIKSLFFTVRQICFVFIYLFVHQQFFVKESWLSSIVYSVNQGTILLGLWVQGHEAGHYAYSTSPLMNDFFGFVLHSFLLVPYFSWKITHRTHHAKCSHLLDGEGHVPDIGRKVVPLYRTILKYIPDDAFVILQIFVHLVLGWPLYLIFHGSGSRRSPITKKRYTSRPNHFIWSSDLYSRKKYFQIFASTFGVSSMLSLLLYYQYVYGTFKVFHYYWGPYMVVNAWVVTYTWLHHTHTDIPHYGEDEWTWLKGALSTVDRPYPWIIDELHHHIGSTHVLHHLCPEIPHYNAKHATLELKRHLKSDYHYEPKGILESIWDTATKCHYVDDVNGVQYYKTVLDRSHNMKEKKF
jgi:omega-6 fatty acid desaturase (delta-12 desaturase)